MALSFLPSFKSSLIDSFCRQAWSSEHLIQVRSCPGMGPPLQPNVANGEPIMASQLARDSFHVGAILILMLQMRKVRLRQVRSLLRVIHLRKEQCSPGTGEVTAESLPVREGASLDLQMPKALPHLAFEMLSLWPKMPFLANLCFRTLSFQRCLA